MLLSGDVDTCWNNWKNYFLSIMDRFIPHSLVTHEERLPWINSTVLKAIRKRKTLFQLYKHTGSQLDHDKYKQQRNAVVTLLRVRKEDYFKNLNPSNAKDFWNSIKKLNNKSTTIPTLNNDGTLVCTSQGKATLISDFFFGCFNRQYPPLGSACSPIGQSSNLDPQEFPEELLCSVDNIADMLAYLDPSKSTGADKISARMLKSCAYSIAPSLTKLFNLSLKTGIVPSEWKIARIVPIPKTDCPSTSTSGYRPISVLPIISKVLEQHVKELIDDYVANNAPISKYQWGFMHQRSSTSALISVTHDWHCSLDSGKEVCIVFFDVKKAFDSVPHIPLLQKLSEAGLDPFLLRWIENYLTKREQFSVVNGYSSNPLQVLSGVPQGSVLGPLLFITYINDVVNQILPDSSINLFADDIALYKTINAPEDYIGLQEDITAVARCLHSKSLDLNASKCCYLFLSRKKTCSILPPPLMLNDVPLKCVTSYKYLGVLITSDLLWSSHISNICNKTRRLIGIMYRRFYKHSSSNTLLKLYTSFIRPHLEYAAISWDPYLKKDIALLEDVQKFALKVCTKSWDQDYSTLLAKSHLPSLETRRHQAKLCNLYNIMNELTYYPNAPLLCKEQRYVTRSSRDRLLVPIPSHSN